MFERKLKNPIFYIIIFLESEKKNTDVKKDTDFHSFLFENLKFIKPLNKKFFNKKNYVFPKFFENCLNMSFENLLKTNWLQHEKTIQNITLYKPSKIFIQNMIYNNNIKNQIPEYMIFLLINKKTQIEKLPSNFTVQLLFQQRKRHCAVYYKFSP